MKQYEYLHVAISPRALELVGIMVECGLATDTSKESQEVLTEVRNFANECRARVQHADAGMPDPGWPGETDSVPGRSADEDWLS